MKLHGMKNFGLNVEKTGMRCNLQNSEIRKFELLPEKLGYKLESLVSYHNWIVGSPVTGEYTDSSSVETACFLWVYRVKVIALDF